MFQLCRLFQARLNSDASLLSSHQDQPDARVCCPPRIRINQPDARAALGVASGSTDLSICLSCFVVLA
eukprot:5033304-Amphidinium_carterae.1